MSDKPAAKPEDSEAEAATRPEGGETPAADPSASDGGADSASEGADPVGNAPDATAELRAEVADLKDRLLRAAAEMENMRRRYEREMSDARQYAVTGFAREVLSISDNLGRALAAVPEDASKEGGALSGLIEGVEMTERELLRVLDKHNVKRIEPEGTKFDPNFHQAMFEVENNDVPNGTVVQVVQHGYSIGERVLRPALVGVSKANPAAKSEPAPAAKEASGKESDSEKTAEPNAANDG